MVQRAFLLAASMMVLSCKTTPSSDLADDTARSPEPEALFRKDVIAEIRPYTAKRDHRLQHYLWHGTRNGWNEYSAEEKKAFLKMYPDWEPPRPEQFDKDGRPQCYATKTASQKDCIVGEDFLYMHHVMIGTLNEQLATKGLEKTSGWRKIPDQSDVNYPLVIGPDGPTEVQTDPFFETMRLWEKQYTDQAYLKTVTLGQLGTAIEFTLHNWMHMRWADFNKEVTVDIPLFDPIPTPAQGWKLDDESQDWLGSPYTAHVNPVFWKLHGWVEDRLTDWLTANGYQTISDSETCAPPSCYKWKGTWAGGMNHVSKGPLQSGAPKQVLNAKARAAFAKKFASFATMNINTPMSRVKSRGPNPPPTGSPVPTPETIKRDFDPRL